MANPTTRIMMTSQTRLRRNHIVVSSPGVGGGRAQNSDAGAVGQRYSVDLGPRFPRHRGSTGWSRIGGPWSVPAKSEARSTMDPTTIEPRAAETLPSAASPGSLGTYGVLAPASAAPEWSVKDGVAEITLHHWRQFLDLVLQDEMLPYQTIWRGQKRDL